MSARPGNRALAALGGLLPRRWLRRRAEAGGSSPLQELRRLHVLSYVAVFVLSQVFLHVFISAYIERLLVSQRLEQNEQLVRMALDVVRATGVAAAEPAARQRVLQELASRTFFDRESFVCFIDANGYIVAHPDVERIGLFRGDQQIRTEEGLRPFFGERSLVGGIWNNTQFASVEIVSSLFDDELALAAAAHQDKALVDRHLGTIRWYFTLLSVVSLGLLFGAAWALTRTHVESCLDRISRHEGDLEAFNASVSHDLKGPLRSIDGFSQLLAEEYGPGLDDEGRRYLDHIRRAGQRMQRLVTDLLRLSQATRKALVRKPVDLTATAREIAQELHQQQPDRQVALEITPGITVTGDPDLLRILLENLIGNAWKYTGKRADARIQLGVESDRDVLFVRDNGVGFDMRDAGRLFEPFHRLHRDDDFEGTGVGLATVKRIVERHGGRVWARSEANEGTTFWFTLS